MGSFSIGERFGDYRLVRSLGEGGFASVYLGEEVHEGTLGAVKLLKEQQVHNFINEVSRTFRLQHPNIVRILDFGIRTLDNTAYIIMEYAPNGSLRQLYPRGTRVPLDGVVLFVNQVAAALQCAHDQRIIHRDVKPENLLLNAQNRVLLSDFGIATATRTARTSNVESSDITGTYAYMSPEQLKGHPMAASDQYSLAIMVYEWLCGELPFEGREYIQWLYVHQEVSPPSLREHIPSLSPDVEQVVLRALAKRPEERFERVESFALALAQTAHREETPLVVHSPVAPTLSAPHDTSPVGEQRRLQPEVGTPLAVESEPKEPPPVRSTYQQFRQDKLYAGTLGVTSSEFLLLGGVGTLVGAFTQSWLLAIGAVAVLFLLAYVLGYRKALSPLPLGSIAVASGVLACAVTLWLASAQYDQVQSSQLWLGIVRTLTLRHQIIAGACIGAVCSLTGFYAFVSSEETSYEVELFAGAILFGIGGGFVVWLIMTSLGTIFDWGFGFGYGWLFNLLYGFFAATTAGIGVIFLLYIWNKARRA